MADPLSGPKVNEGSSFRRFIRRAVDPANLKKAAEGTYEAVVPPKEMFDKPSSFVKGIFKTGEKVQESINKDALGIVNKQFGPKAELALQDIEANKLLGKLIGGPNAKLANEIIGSKLGQNDELPTPQPVVTADGRTVLIRPGDLERLAEVNAQRAREGRPLLPSPLDPVAASTNAPAVPVLPASRPAAAHPSPSTLPNTEKPSTRKGDPEQPTRPALVRFIDP